MMTVSGGLGVVSVVLTLLAAVALPVAAIWVISFVLRGIFKVVGGVLRAGGFLGLRLGGFVRRELTDALQLAGGVLTGSVIAPLALGNLAIGRLRSAKHFARAIEDEYMGAAISLYRVAIGNPARLLGLSPLTHGLERRLPDLVAGTPVEDSRKRRSAPPAFGGYVLRSELPAGGSGARLYLARPTDQTRQRYLAAGHADPGEVVIKSFALVHGSTLPQIVRESRALVAARRLGLVLDHELSDDSFWYAMPFVPGDDLDVVTRRLHATAEPDGLGRRATQKVLGYASDLCDTLDRFHREGLWHKDIKPSNLIVSGDRVHLVDLGLVTPLASAMTLTTHGTEYYRDPELVRRAIQGVKVCDVDGVKFDLYSAGAVLYSMIENSFPAHGSLSRISRRCPDALAFVVRRAMADIGERYASAAEMGRDVRALLAAPDPFQVRPADLPSMGGASSVAGPTAAGLRPAPADERVSLEELVAAAEPPPRRPSRVERRGARAARGGRGRRLLRGLAVATCVAAVGHAMLRARVHREGAFAHAEHARALAVARQHRLAGLDGGVLLSEPAPPAPYATIPAGRILLLQDFSVTGPQPALGALREALIARGAEVLDERSADPAVIDLIAGARRAVELAPLNDADAGRRLQRFLTRTPDLDCVLWIGTSVEGELQYRCFTR